MDTLTYTYFALNTFLAGCFFQWIISNGKIKTAWDTIATTITLILMLFAGIPVFIVAAILTRND